MMTGSLFTPDEIRARQEEVRFNGYLPAEVELFFDGLMRSTGPEAEAAAFDLVDHMADDLLSMLVRRYVMREYPASSAYPDYIGTHCFWVLDRLCKTGFDPSEHLTTGIHVTTPSGRIVDEAWRSERPGDRGPTICAAALKAVVLQGVRDPAPMDTRKGVYAEEWLQTHNDQLKLHPRYREDMSFTQVSSTYALAFRTRDQEISDADRQVLEEVVGQVAKTHTVIVPWQQAERGDRRTS